MFSIRPAREEDYLALVPLFEEIDALHRDRLPFMFRKPGGPARTLEYFRGLIADPNTVLFLAELDGRLIGYVQVEIRVSPPVPILVPRRFAVIDSLVVRAPFRRRGFGLALMQAAHSWARTQDITEIELNVYTFNQDALNFYRRLGYTSIRSQLHLVLDEPETED